MRDVIMSKQRSSAKSLIITDDEELEAEELNPFSFREFLRWKNQDPDQDHDQEQKNWKVSSSLTFDPEFRTCFFSEPSLGQLESQDEEAEWERSVQAGVDSMLSLCTGEEETRYSSKPDVHERGRDSDGGDEEETLFAESAEPDTCRTMQKLKEDNLSLTRTIRELQRTSETHKRRVEELSNVLLHRRRQEEEEALDLENMVQSVEQNLTLMTKRALKAESSVSKLRAETQHLQTQVESLRLENNRLKSAESEVVMTMKHKAQMASEYLKRTASQADSSIRQMLGDADTLRLVAQLLQSIDRISELNSES